MASKHHRRHLALPFLAAIAAALLAPGCQESASATRTQKVAVIKYQHETCTFCPGGDTTTDDWSVIGAEDVLASDRYINGFMHAVGQFDNLTAVGITSPGDVFGGSSRSWNSRESFEHFMNMILADLADELPVDGVYLALHGALAVRGIPRPEAEIARRVRAAVGPDVPIAATFDLHGNEDAEFLKHADAAFVTKRYPHYDAFIQGGRAADFLRRSIAGDYRATTASAKPPVITATVLQWTGQPPSMDIMERARRWEARHPDAYVSVFYGFPWSDVPDVGAAVHVVTNGDQALADSIAADMAAYIWRVRQAFANGSFPMPGEAVETAAQAIDEGRTPVVLADYSDRPGDATWILRALVEREVGGVLYACLTDAPALRALREAGAEPGDTFDREVGGYSGEQAGQPVHIRGKVAYFGPGQGYDEIAIIEFGEGNALVITPAYTQVTSPEQLRFGPLDPDEFQLFVVKSRVHFRRGFDETGYAKTILVVDAPGPWFGTTRLDALDYEFAPIDRLYPFGAPP